MVSVTKRKLLFASLTLSIITLLFLLLLTINGEIFILLAKINPFYLILAIGAHITAWIILSFRLKIMSEFVGVGEKREEENLKFFEYLKIILISYFAACITPSQFGSAPMRIYLLNRRGFTVGDGTMVTIGERALDFVIIMISAIFSFFIFRNIMQGSFLYSIFTTIAIILICVIAFMAYGFVNPWRIKKFLDFFFSKSKFKKLEKIKGKIYGEIWNFYEAKERIKYRGKMKLFVALFFTIAFWILEFTVPSLILLGFGNNPIWIYSIAAQFILIIIMVVPTTPGSSGVAEISFASLYTPLIGAPISGMLTLIWRLIIYYSNLIVGGVVSLIYMQE